MTEGRQPFTAEIKTLAKGPSTYAKGPSTYAKGPSTYDPLENTIRKYRSSTHGLANGGLGSSTVQAMGRLRAAFFVEMGLGLCGPVPISLPTSQCEVWLFSSRH